MSDTLTASEWRAVAEKLQAEADAAEARAGEAWKALAEMSLAEAGLKVGDVVEVRGSGGRGWVRAEVTGVAANGGLAKLLARRVTGRRRWDCAYLLAEWKGVPAEWRRLEVKRGK